MFYALAENEDFLKDRVNLFIALAPVVRLTHASNGFLGSVANRDGLLQRTFKTLRMNEILNKDWSSQFGFNIVCKLMPFFCNYGVYVFNDGQADFNDISRVNISRSKFPNGSSVRQLIHFAQLIKYKQFQYFDFQDKTLNTQAYGELFADRPPQIPLENIEHVPVAMFVGKQDDLSNPEDT